MMMSSGFLLVSIVIGAVLIYLPFLVVGYARFQVGYDISAPRAMFDKLPPYAKRAAWAHQNSFEAFALFAPAALMAYVTGQASQVAIGAAIVYLVSRTLYPIFYILDVPLLRSLMFGLGGLGTFTLFVVSCRSVLM
ncbi:MAG: MAPEG family protein [Cyanobacteria bacterium Co-bin13]|nr:MAPEG family protein [Cyanobacteria bacterium Co-bin13]